MPPESYREFWDFVIDSLAKRGVINWEQAAFLSRCSDDELRDALYEAISNATWQHVESDVAEYMLDIVGVDSGVDLGVLDFSSGLGGVEVFRSC